MWYLGLGLLMLGTGCIGATKRKGLWYLERILIVLPLIIVLEPLVNTFFFHTAWLPMTLHGSILINSYEVALACVGFLLGKALIHRVKVKDLWGWAKAFGFGFSVVLAIIFFPLYLFFSLVFHKVTLEEFLEVFDEEV